MTCQELQIVNYPGGMPVVKDGLAAASLAPSGTGAKSPQVTLQVTPQVTPEVTCARQTHAITDRGALGEDPGRQVEKAGPSTDQVGIKFRDQVLNAGLVEMTVPDKPRSSRQKYRLTEKGRRFLAERRA